MHCNRLHCSRVNFEVIWYTVTQEYSYSCICILNISDSAICTGVIQMMLPVLLTKSFVNHHIQSSKTLLLSAVVNGRTYDASDYAVIQDMIRLSIYSNSKFLHVMNGIPITRTTI